MSTTCGCDEENDHKTMKNHKTLAFSTLQKEDRRHAKRVTSVLLRQTITRKAVPYDLSCNNEDYDFLVHHPNAHQSQTRNLRHLQ